MAVVCDNQEQKAVSFAEHNTKKDITVETQTSAEDEDEDDENELRITIEISEI